MRATPLLRQGARVALRSGPQEVAAVARPCQGAAERGGRSAKLHPLPKVVQLGFQAVNKARHNRATARKEGTHMLFWWARLSYSR
jgi:hypothetical protein